MSFGAIAALPPVMLDPLQHLAGEVVETLALPVQQLLVGGAALQKKQGGERTIVIAPTFASTVIRGACAEMRSWDQQVAAKGDSAAPGGKRDDFDRHPRVPNRGRGDVGRVCASNLLGRFQIVRQPLRGRPG